MTYEYLLLKKSCENIIYDKRVFLSSKEARKEFRKGDILYKCKKESVYFSDNFRGWSVNEKDIVATYEK